MKLNPLFALCLSALATVCHAEELPTPYVERIHCAVGEDEVNPLVAEIVVPLPEGFAAALHADLEDNPELRNARGEIVPASASCTAGVTLSHASVYVRFAFPQSNSVTFTGTLLLDLCKEPVEHRTDLLPVEKLPQQVQLLEWDINLRLADPSEEYIGVDADEEALVVTFPTESGLARFLRCEDADGKIPLPVETTADNKEICCVYALPKKQKVVRFCCKQYTVTHSIKVPIRLRFGICGELAPRSE